MQGFPFDSQLTFDSDNLPVYDRAVSSQPLRKLIRDLFTTGVMPNPSTNLQVSFGTDGMTVQVQAGFAVVDGGLCQETETRTLEVTAADTTYDRIDTVVLRWNENVDARTADLYVVAGTPSATPVRPALQRDNSIYEIGLADIFITKRVATITDDKITDTRYEDERCGIVSSVSEWDTTTIYQQIQAELAGFKANEEAEFVTWFDYMKDQLSEDAAGHLQEEIDELQPVRKRTLTNLLNPTISTKTESGITCTNNGDGTYTLNGTATANAFFDAADGSTPFTLPQGEYRYCGTPSDIGASTSTIKSGLLKADGTGVVADDIGNGFTFQSDGVTQYVFRMAVYKGTTVDNVLFKPMITTDLYASYDEFVQYSGDGELNENVSWLYRTFSNALTSLKNTAIAQAVGATGSTFTSVIAKLAEIVVRGNATTVKWNDNNLRIVDGWLGSRGTCTDGIVRSVFEIPQGWYGSHDGTRDLIGVTDDKIIALGFSGKLTKLGDYAADTVVDVTNIPSRWFIIQCLNNASQGVGSQWKDSVPFYWTTTFVAGSLGWYNGNTNQLQIIVPKVHTQNNFVDSWLNVTASVYYVTGI